MPRPQTETELRRCLARELGVEEVPPMLWQALEDESLVEPALTSEEDLDLLVDRARRARDVGLEFLAMRRGIRRPTVDRKLRGLFAPHEVERARYLSMHIARAAASERVVRRFWSQVLGGRLLDPDKAEAFLRQPAPYLLSRAEFEARGIPLLDHIAQVARSRTDREGGWVETLDLELTGAGVSASYHFTVERTVFDRRWLELPNHLMVAIDQCPVLDGSVFSELRSVCDWLEKITPWRPYEPLWFVLTGISPWVLPVREGIKRSRSATYHRTEVTLEVEPWVSAETVGRFYREIQQEILGRENRAIQPKSLALFNFVTERREPGQPPMTWFSLMQEWNRTHPDWQYGDARHFQRDYRRTGNALAFPRYEGRMQSAREAREFVQKRSTD
jgi:hypothetical protein